MLDSPQSGVSALVSHRPDPVEGWLELLIDGVTFELRGLSPADPSAPGEPAHAYGFDDAGPADALEAIELIPGGHIAGGARLLPVTRAMLGLGADLALRLPVAAVVWQPARTIMEPRYFSRVVLSWLSGGAFPALGLTALVPTRDGGVASDGLSHFIDQELQLEGKDGEAPAEAVKLAIRLVDHLTRHGPVTAPREIEQGDLALLAEPAAGGRRVCIWRPET